MRIHLLLFLLFAFYFHSQAQTSSAPDTTSKSIDTLANGEQVYTDVNEMPEFPGGEQALSKYVHHLIYPQDAIQRGISGTAYVQYIIDKDGNVTDVKIVPGKELYPSLDKAAMDLIRNSPKWKPGKQNGVPVAVKKIAQIKFTLNKD